MYMTMKTDFDLEKESKTEEHTTVSLTCLYKNVGENLTSNMNTQGYVYYILRRKYEKPLDVCCYISLLHFIERNDYTNTNKVFELNN